MKEALEKFDILRDLSNDELEGLKWFVEQETLEEGRTVFTPYDEASELILLVDGQIVLELDGVPVGELGPGSALGGVSLIRIGERACTARARDTVSILKLSRESYLRLRADYPYVALALQEGIVKNLARALDVVLEREQRE